jgi:hypothetical protein
MASFSHIRKQCFRFFFLPFKEIHRRFITFRDYVCNVEGETRDAAVGTNLCVPRPLEVKGRRSEGLGEVNRYGSIYYPYKKTFPSGSTL